MLTAILAPDTQPLLDPADMALMATPDQLRNATSKNQQVSFLRRTRYISSTDAARADMTRNPALRTKTKKVAQEKQPPISKDDPSHIKRHIQKGFDIAYPENRDDDPSALRGLPASASEIEAWRNPVHPDNPSLKPLDFYPFLPDLDGTTDSGNYITVKFDKPPLPAVNGKRDDRIDVSLLTAVTNDVAVQAHRAKVELYKQHPEVYADPGPEPYELDFMIPESQSLVPKIKSKLDDANPDKNSPEGYEQDKDGKTLFSYERQRIYGLSKMGVTDDPFRSIAISLFDPNVPSSSRHSRLATSGQKAAYYYPIAQRMTLKPERKNDSQAPGPEPTEGGHIDRLNLVVRDPDEEELYKRAYCKSASDARYREGAFKDLINPFEENGEEEMNGLGTAGQDEQQGPVNEHDAMDET